MNRSLKSHLSWSLFVTLSLVLAVFVSPAATHAVGGADQEARGLRLFSLAYGHRDLAYVQAYEPAASSAPAYEIVGIEPPADRVGTKAYGINNSGQVAGRSHNVDGAGGFIDRQAFLWDPVNGLQVLPTLDGDSSPWGVNDSGQISGISYTSAGYSHAVRWDTLVLPFVINDLSTLANSTTLVSGDSSVAYDLNNLGLVAGSSDIPNDAGDFMPFHAIVHDDTSGLVDLGTLTTAYPEWQNGYSIAYDANNDGEVVGIAHNSSWEFRAFVYDAAGGLHELNRDLTYGTNEWYATAINDSGLIGGHVIAAVDQSLPYYWPGRLSDPVPITMPATFPYGEIYGMNAEGVMVGIMWDDAGVEHGFVLDTDRGVRDLNDLIDPSLGWVLTFARDINDSGQIVGTGERNGEMLGFVLDPSGVVFDELAVDFGTEGLFHFQSTWLRLSPSNPEDLEAWQNKLAVDFGSSQGLFLVDSLGWTNLTSWDPYLLTAWGDKLAIAFAGEGLFLYDGAWTHLTTWEPIEVVAWGDNLVVDFGPALGGVFVYDGGWSSLTAWDPYLIAPWGDKLVFAFDSGRGLFFYDGTWSSLSTWEPEDVVAWGDKLVIDFGAGNGLFLYGSSTGWQWISSQDPHLLCVWSGDLAVVFDTGTFLYDETTGWSGLSSWVPVSMTALEQMLVLDFGPGTGIYSYDGNWTQLTGWSAEAMEPVNLN